MEPTTISFEHALVLPVRLRGLMATDNRPLGPSMHAAARRSV